MSPRGSRLLAAAVLGSQFLLLAARAPDRQDDAANLLAGATFRALAPVLGVVSKIADGFESFGRERRARGELEAENRRLKEELALLRRERLRLAGLDTEAEELARGLAFARQSGLELRAAEVVYSDLDSWLRTLVVRVGARGARLDQAVLAEEGVVGRVISTSGPWAKVQLITDRAAAVGVELESARRQGIAHGEEGDLLIDYVPLQAEVTVGERVLTAGIDGVYPRGLPVGVVIAVDAGTELFHRIRARPAVDLAQLSTLFLLERGPEPPRPAPAGSTDAGIGLESGRP